MKADYSKKWIIMELDGTLINSCRVSRTNVAANEGNDQECFVTSDSTSLLTRKRCTRQYSVQKRAFADQLIQLLLPNYNIVLYTNMEKAFADKIIDKLFPNVFCKRFYRGHTRQKDLLDIQVDLTKAVFVDAKPRATKQWQNQICISKFKKACDDVELCALASFLISKNACPPMPTYVQNWSQFRKEYMTQCHKSMHDSHGIYPQVIQGIEAIQSFKEVRAGVA